MSNIKNGLILCLLAFSISDLLAASNLEKQDKQLNTKNLLSSVTHSKDIRAVIAGYLKNEWELDRVILTKNDVSSVEFSPDGKNIALSHNNSVEIFEVDSRRKIQELYGMLNREIV